MLGYFYQAGSHTGHTGVEAKSAAVCHHKREGICMWMVYYSYLVGFLKIAAMLLVIASCIKYLFFNK